MEFLGYTNDGHNWFRGKCNCEWGRVTVEAYEENGFWVWDYACGHGRQVIKEEQLENEKMAMKGKLTAESGEMNEFIKYNAKAGRWYIKNQVEGGQDVEVVGPKMAFDFENVKTGWFLFQAGVGPVKHFDPPNGTAERPEGNFKHGFEIMVSNSELGLREFCSTAGAVIRQMLIMEQQYDDGKAANQGKVPIFLCTGVNALENKHGVNYEPVFSLEGWVERNKVDGFYAPAPEIVPSGGDDIPF